MKIAQIAPLMESVPPRLYGGTERIVSYLTDELVRLGHEVTLFVSADCCRAGGLRPHGITPRRQRPRPDPLLTAGGRGQLQQHASAVATLSETVVGYFDCGEAW
jgi:hypothetical protein